MSLVVIASGFLFLFILVLNIVMAVFGYTLDLADVDSDAELQKISTNPKKWKIGIGFALIEHGCVIALAILLFVTFSPFNLILGAVLVISRIGEGLVQFHNENTYWGLLSIAKQYSGNSGAAKEELSGQALSILKLKDHRFNYTMILWAIGTLAFSIVLVTADVVPLLIGWIGIIGSIFIGLSNGLKTVNRNVKILTVFALLGIIFEIGIGGWLLFVGIP